MTLNTSKALTRKTAQRSKHRSVKYNQKRSTFKHKKGFSECQFLIVERMVSLFVYYTMK